MLGRTAASFPTTSFVVRPLSVIDITGGSASVALRNGTSTIQLPFVPPGFSPSLRNSAAT